MTVLIWFVLFLVIYQAVCWFDGGSYNPFSPTRRSSDWSGPSESYSHPINDWDDWNDDDD